MIDTDIFEMPTSKLDCGKYTLYEYFQFSYVLKYTNLNKDILRNVASFIAYTPRCIDRWRKQLLLNDLGDFFRWSGARFHHVPARTLFLSLCLSGHVVNTIYLDYLLHL